PCQAVSDRRKLRKPGPAISTFASRSLGGRASTSACASARGLALAGLASSIAALLEKSPWPRSLGRSTTNSGVAMSAGRVPRSRRVSMPCSTSWRTRARRGVFTGLEPVAAGYGLYASTRRGFRRSHKLHPAAGGEGDGRAVADDEVVEQADVDQRQGLLEARGDRAVRGAGLGAAAGMVVPDDHRRRVAGQRVAHHFARMHLRAVHGAAEQLLERQGPVPGVQEQRREHLARMPAQALREIAAGRGWVGERLAPLQAGGEEPV